MPPRVRALVLIVAPLLLVASGLTSPVFAEHTQESGDKAVAFEHKTGNEWWVEVVLSGPDAASVSNVEAADEGGPWIQLEKKSWGAWGGSFHIEPGHDVRFRAGWEDQFRGVTSCWFSHPDGDERCQSTWQVTTIGRSGSDVQLRGSVAGDVDHDGAEELVVATSHGLQLHVFDDGWQHQETMGSSSFSAPHIADLDDDGAMEIVAAVVGIEEKFTRFVYDGTWQQMTYTGPADADSALTTGDPDGDGVDAVYTADHGPDVPVYEVRLVDGAWEEVQIATVSEGVGVLHVGDGDGDGDDELYAGGGYKGDDSLFQIESTPNGWVKTQIGTEHGTNSVFGIGTGDTDGDGADELYHTTSDIGEPHALWRNTFDGDWTQERVASYPDQRYPLALDVADGDNDGLDEVYVGVRGQNDHRVFQAQPSELGWDNERIAVLDGGGDPMLSSGDVDGDDRIELYVTEGGEDGFIHEVSEHEPGNPSGPTFTFNSRNGNEWWVQVHITGDQPSRVQAMDTGDPWKELTLRDWGDWARSFHVEPGNDVRFRAMVDGAWHASCTFTHPEGKTLDGAETCGIEDTSSPPPDDFEATFQTSGGNDWWVEVYVDASQPLAGVDARDDGGPWIALEKTSWGSWAKSFHVEDGSLIEFRATSTDGAAEISAAYRWPDGTQAS